MQQNMNELFERLDRIEKILFGQQKTVLNMGEASELTGYSKSHLYKLTSTGGVPCYKPHGKEIFFNREELEQWMQGGRRATAEELKTIASTFATLNPYPTKKMPSVDRPKASQNSIKKSISINSKNKFKK